ncbi:UNVERIFIED_CONTAM: hypothetical protein GTU68_032902 [Idotea baltica]|nr:hypothetical protein [Idotea baltica]
MSSGTRRAFDLLRTLPRISLKNLKPNPGANKPSGRQRGSKTHGCGIKGSGQRQNFMPVGYETGNTPFHMRFKCQAWNNDIRMKLSYIPLPLHKLQQMIDLERVRTDIPIDVVQLSLSGVFREIRPMEREGGFLLQNEGLDVFASEVNLEVQWVTEPQIAAIERSGSTVTTAYYDPFSLDVAKDPQRFFTRGTPIPRRMLPPQNLIEYYSDPKNRGYLADPDAIAEERFILSQKYGYKLPDLKASPKYEMLLQRKDPRQIFHGLQPGWVVNLVDKTILKPKDEELIEYYAS